MSMTESEKVKKWFDSELSMRPEESLDSVECEEVKDICLNSIDEKEQYRAIGTVSEFRELKEKATAKKAIVSRSKHEAYCPHCKSVVADDEFWALDEYVHHCECGQAILGTDWSEGKE